MIIGTEDKQLEGVDEFDGGVDQIRGITFKLAATPHFPTN